MIKSIIIFSIILLSAGKVVAQEFIFKNFDVEKGNKQHFIVKPKNYESLLKSKQIDTLFYIGLKYYEKAEDMIAKGRLYENWQKKVIGEIVPEEISEVIQQVMNKDSLHHNVQYNLLYLDVLIDHEGNYLSINFRMSDNLIKTLTEKQIQEVYDAFIAAKKVDPEMMDITNMGDYYTTQQNNEMFEYMHSHQKELKQQSLFTPLKVFDKLGIKPNRLDYALLEFQVGDTQKVYKQRKNSNLQNHN